MAFEKAYASLKLRFENEKSAFSFSLSFSAQNISYKRLVSIVEINSSYNPMAWFNKYILKLERCEMSNDKSNFRLLSTNLIAVSDRSRLVLFVE